MSIISKYIKTSPTRLQLPLSPPGTYVAIITAVMEERDVERPRFNAPNETEILDLTTIVCAYRDSSGTLHLVTSAPMRTSADPKSALVAFITGVLGATPWTSDPNWDTQAMVGVRLQLSVTHQQSKRSGRVYARITNVAPAMAEFAGYAPTLAEAQAALRSYQDKPTIQGQPRVIAPLGTASPAVVWPSTASLNLGPVQGAVVPVIQPPGVAMPQTGAAPAAAWPVYPASFAPPVFSGQPPLPAMGGQAAPAAPPTAPVMPPPGQSPTTPLSPSQPGNAPFVPSAENPDVKF